nr:DUF3365 domain-containing protein [uncultured Duganella sp.]
MRIEIRFAWIIAACFGLGLLIAGYSSYRLEQRQAHEEIKLKADMLLDTASAVRDYTSDEVAGVVRQIQDGNFHPQQVPSFSAQNAIARVTRKYTGYTYRESSLNPTNPNDRASDWEVGLIRIFQADKGSRELSGEIGNPADKRFYVARPIRMSSAACLQCHSTPAAAPAVMVARYGPNNGFGWTMNDVVGLQIVEVPTATARSKALNSVLLTVTSLSSVFVLSAVAVLTLLRRYVSRPLESLTAAASRSSVEQHGGELAAPPAGGQFGELHLAIQRLRTSVDQTLRMLEPRDGARKPDDKE